MTSNAATRLEFRIRPDVKRKIEAAAGLLHETASDFARSAAEARADEVLRAHQGTTVVPAEFFDALLAELDAPDAVNEPLARAAARLREQR
ncbi:MAG TPA: DUF1778 domain-containing protein [Mycobacteriales bacterium]|jgi:uncharacterized protein (DUF1778 family)|nr:DUF1778 domain-containing protein [Mycobacteriales bacterium]